MPYDQVVQTQLQGLYNRAWDSDRMLVLEVPVENLLSLVTKLKNDLGFDLFLDVTAIDYPDREPRFDVVYHFYAVQHKKRLRLKTRVTEADPTVPTLIGL